MPGPIFTEVESFRTSVLVDGAYGLVNQKSFEEGVTLTHIFGHVSDLGTLRSE